MVTHLGGLVVTNLGQDGDDPYDSEDGGDVGTPSHAAVMPLKLA